MTPEQAARQQIDEQPTNSGWVVQDYKAVDFSTGRGIALREVPLKTGPCDYLLLVDRRAVGVIEAKKQGTTLSAVADQSARYASSLPDFLSAGSTAALPAADQPDRGAPRQPSRDATAGDGVSPATLPFLYESTGVETLFRDTRDPDARSRRVFSFHRPETLADWAAEPDTLRARLKAMPTAHPLVTGSGNGTGTLPAAMRDCQIEAITGLEKSFAENRPRALIHMATGAGKTYTACAFTYRLIKHAGARRILFLVDRANLGEQARDEFHRFRTPDTGRLFTELYNVQHLTSPHLDDVCRVTICTIQRLYSILRGEELDEDLDEKSGYEIATAYQSGSGVSPLAADKSRDGSSTLPVAYTDRVPIEKFDFIVTDECHRSIYNLWRQVLEYLDAFLVGLTATPAPQTIAYFHQNRVAEYNHERAVADGVNVGYDVYRIKTRVTEQGGKVEKGFLIDHRSKASRAQRSAVLADDLDYTPADLDRSVVVPDQIRTVLRTYRDAVATELFPGRTLVPKTLIFAKDDSHAEDIVHLCREVFGRGNDFCKKITHKATMWQRRPAADSEQASGETPLPRQRARELIKEFCLSPTLRIAVTVDMIATGTDIKPLEVLIFLRDVRSRVYFEQMKGRGTRVLTPTDLQAVSGEDARAKTRFIIVDAVGVCESDKTESRPLDRQPTVPLKTLLQRVIFPGGRDEDTLTTLAARLARLERELDPAQRQQIAAASGGHTPATLAGALLRAYDPDEVEAASRRFAREHALVQDPAAFEDGERSAALARVGYFDPETSVDHLSGNLPHWRQEGATYFVTFRLADSLPQEKLRAWHNEREEWLRKNPEPHTPEQRSDFYDRFPKRLQAWLDAGYGSMILDLPEVRRTVEDALRFFVGQRYALDEFVVAPNHVHVLVTPMPGFELSDILHSWKSYTAHEILKVEAASRRLVTVQQPPGTSTYVQSTGDAASRRVSKRRHASSTSTVWQKESFDHIVRNPASLDKFRAYIRAHDQEDPWAPVVTEDLRRDAAATLIATACAPFDKPALRATLETLKQETEQALDIFTPDAVVSQGFDAAAKAKAAGLVQAFRDYLAKHQTEIDALQILYSRPYNQRLTEPMLKELEKKLRDNHAAWTEDRLWDAFAVTAPDRVKGRSQAGRFADLVSLVRFALEKQSVLEPFADSVAERFDRWLAARQSRSGVPPLDPARKRRDAASTFTPEQLAWLHLMRDHIATSLSLEPDDFAPFAQRGGLGRAHQLFGAQLPTILDQLNAALVA